MNKKLIADIYPLSPMQEGMLYHYLADTDSNEYFEQIIFEVKGKLDIAKLEFAWNHIIENNEVLRTVFRWEGVEKPLQIVLNNRPMKIRNIDLTGTSDYEAKIAEIKAKDIEEGFDLGRGPLIRVTVYQLTDDKYIIIWNYHHIIFDGWSMGIIFKDIFTIYNQLMQGLTPKITPKMKYKDYIKFLLGQDQNAAIQYWRDYLENFTIPTYFPADLPKNTAISRIKEESLRLAPDLYERLQQIAKKYRVTVNVILQVAWGILLQKYTYSADVVFGATVSGRPHDLAGAYESVGLFINTVPVRVKRIKDQTIAELLKKHMEDSFKRKNYEYVSLTEIQAQSELMRQTSLFDHIIVYENYPIDESLNQANPEGIEIVNITAHEMTNYDLTLTVFVGETLMVKFAYNDEIFTDRTIQRLSDHLRNILNEMITNPEAKVSAVKMLSANEREEILGESAGPVSKYPVDKCIHQFFEEQAKRIPDDIALVCGKDTLKYRELNERANSLARLIKNEGLKPDTIVGIMVERSLNMVIGLLAILKAGGAYLPIDSHFPAERIKYMLEDSGAEFLLTESRLSDEVSELFKGNVMVMEDLLNSDCLDKSEIKADVRSNNLAYVIYTSGSTGQPKGIQIEHRSVANFISGLGNALPFKEGKVFLAVTTISFDISVLEIFLTLAHGLKVVIADSEAQRDTEKINELIVNERVEMVQMTPSMMQMLLNSDFSGENLKEILLGGEPLPHKVLAELQSKTTARIYNMYGQQKLQSGQAIRK